MRWVALLVAVIGVLIVAASCEVKVPLGVDPHSDGALVDAADAGVGG